MIQCKLYREILWHSNAHIWADSDARSRKSNVPQGNEKAEPDEADRFSGLQSGTFFRLCDLAKKQWAMVELVDQFSCV